MNLLISLALVAGLFLMGTNSDCGKVRRMPRKAVVDRLADNPFLRKAVMRLPKLLRPAAELSSHVIAFNDDGVILMNMQDPEARYPTLTGVLETRDYLYLTTLYGNVLPVIAKRDL